MSGIAYGLLGAGGALMVLGTLRVILGRGANQ